MNLLNFQFQAPSASGAILFIASSPSWHSSLVVRRLLELYPDRRIHVVTNHKETLAHQSPRLVFHAYEAPRATLSLEQVATITRDRVQCAFYAQMIESTFEHAHIFRLLLALGITDCYALDAQWNVHLHTGNLGWLLPRAVGPYKLTLPALLSAAELNRLYELAATGPGTGTVVEIGTMVGGSAVALALGSRDSGRGRVHTIDIEPRKEVQQTLEAHRVADLVNVINMPSKEVATNWASFTNGDTAVRLLWIDGNHQYEGVWSDILHWRDYVAPGGVICFHDYSETFPGVVRAVYEHVISSPLFHDFQRVDSIFSAVKRPVANTTALQDARDARMGSAA